MSLSLGVCERAGHWDAGRQWLHKGILGWVCLRSSLFYTIVKVDG